ncbi:MAG: glycosyltransferase family 4 protein [Acidobacteriota bacterium]
MRVGVVTHYMPPHHGGIERVAASLDVAYRERGWQVRWLASDSPKGATEGAKEDADRLRVPTWNVLEDRLGVPVPLWGPTGWRRLAELTRWADVLHVHDCLYPGSYFGAAMARRRGVPVFLTQHIGFVKYGSRLLNGIEHVAYRTMGRRLLRRVDRIVLATPSAELWVNALLPAGTPRQKIYNGIDLERFRPPSAEERRQAQGRLGLPEEDRRTVLFVGRLVEKKGVPVVVEVARRHPEIRFLMVGDGPLAEQVSAAEGRIEHRRSVVPEEMPWIYRAADAFFLPSHGEGLPLVVQEAMACGLPALVSEEEPFAREVTAGAAGGCLAAARTPEAMAEALPALFENGRGDAARTYADARWGFPAMARQYAEVVEELVRSTEDG